MFQVYRFSFKSQIIGYFNDKPKTRNEEPDASPGVEIGRQATLRWWCWKRRAGSNPVPGTKMDKSKIIPVCPFSLNLTLEEIYIIS